MYRRSANIDIRSQSISLSHGCALISAAPSSPSPTLDPSFPAGLLALSSPVNLAFSRIESLGTLPKRSSGSHSSFARKSRQSFDNLGFVGNRSVCFQSRLAGLWSVYYAARCDLGGLHLLPSQMPLVLPDLASPTSTSWKRLTELLTNGG